MADERAREAGVGGERQRHLREHRVLVREVHPERLERVPGVRVDRLGDEQPARAQRALAGVRAVLTEVALIDLYEGAGLESEIEPLVLGAGLEAADALYYELYEGGVRFPAWGDRLFVRP